MAEDKTFPSGYRGHKDAAAAVVHSVPVNKQFYFSHAIFSADTVYLVITLLTGYKKTFLGQRYIWWGEQKKRLVDSYLALRDEFIAQAGMSGRIAPEGLTEPSEGSLRVELVFLVPEASSTQRKDAISGVSVMTRWEFETWVAALSAPSMSALPVIERLVEYAEERLPSEEAEVVIARRWGRRRKVRRWTKVSAGAFLGTGAGLGALYALPYVLDWFHTL